MNERNTENFVREMLRSLNYYKNSNDICVEEQKSNIESVKRLLKSAGKSCKGGKGAPEFIISSPSSPDFLIIIECKADTKDHISPFSKKQFIGEKVEIDNLQYSKQSQRFAVDGVLHYAKYLSKEFNVIAVAVSGQTRKNLIISTYLHPKGCEKPKIMFTKNNREIEELISWADYIEHGTIDHTIQRLRFDELMAFAKELHEFMRDHAKLTESEKPLLVSGTLIALRNKAFTIAYNAYSPEDLQKEWIKVIQTEIQKAEIPKAKKDNMTQPYSSIAVHPELGKPTKAYPKGALHELIKRLNEKVWPFISVYNDFDVVGQFYGEFLKYTGGDKKALGIVLTPRHITDLFALIANVDKSKIVIDICAGTGGFLISAMHHMMCSAVTENEREQIKLKRLIGVEQQPIMFALAASNMILRGDGKANLYQGSCFDEAITKAVKNHSCNIGLLNPPFSQGDADLHELYFIEHMLNCLEKGGVGVAIVPMSCAISPHSAKISLLKHHSLEAVMSMPDDLFYPVGTVTCIMVFTAKIPHQISNRKTWFGYWKNDGFQKTKQRGRIDVNGNWPAIRDRWVETYRNREVHPGESVLQKVTAEDEWCAEAYLETDYKKISKDDFEQVVRRFAMFKTLGAKNILEKAVGND